MDVRTKAHRKRDLMDMLVSEADLWVPSVTEDGDAYLVPLSFAWIDGAIVMATPQRSITARNLKRAGKARVALRPTRDVVICEGAVWSIAPGEDHALSDAHARKAGFDARAQEQEHILLILEPRLIQAWRNPAELENRTVMLNGRWLD